MINFDIARRADMGFAKYGPGLHQMPPLLLRVTAPVNLSSWNLNIFRQVTFERAKNTGSDAQAVILP
jgi:hypothetical protein